MVQAAAGCASSLHWYVTGSLAPNANVGELSLLGSPGFWLIVAVGAVASIVQVWELVPPTLPAWIGRPNGERVRAIAEPE